jgi:tripartite-type tricarboxylate transporter receptor subunit TctC
MIAINANNPPERYSDILLIQKKYPDWVDFDWFCLVLPSDTSIEIIKVWRNFMEQYLSDNNVLKEFKQEFTESVDKDQQSAESTVKTFIEWSGIN